MTDYSDKLVLVADDEPGMVAMVGGYLRSQGFQVIEASDGAQAWELAHERLPDLVILDVMMPGMSGWEVCRKIKEAVSLHHTGVIMLTGIGENLNEMTSPLYGADAYLDKPFEFDDLQARIDETLNSRSDSPAEPEAAAEPKKPSKKRAKKTSPNQGKLFDEAEEIPAAGNPPAVEAPKKAAKPSKSKAAKAAKKATKTAKKVAKKATKTAKKVAKKATKTAKKVAKKATKTAKKAAKAAKPSKPAKKAAKPNKPAKKAAKKAAKPAKKAAKKPAKATKKVADQAAKSVKKASKQAGKPSKKASGKKAAKPAKGKGKK
ncbi:MAG: response regulator [Myxococcales bacterium]|nr:response regulator [Myxococcales bacterium]